MEQDENAGVKEDDSQAPENQQELKQDESGAPPAEQDTTDWKAIAAAERERAENYKTALTQKRQLRNVAPPPAEEDDSTPLTRKDIRNILREEVIPVVSASSKEDSLLTQKIPDSSKRDYVRQLLETRIVRTGTSDADILADIEAALAIADSKKKDKTISELARAAQNKPPAPSAGSSNEKPLEQKTYKWTPEQAIALEKRAKTLGVDPEKFKQDAWANISKTKVV